MARIDIGGDFIIRGADRPVLDNDVANKEYVDLIASGAVTPTPSGVREWVSGTAYSEHDLVTVDGFIYRALVTITAASTDSMVSPDAGNADAARLWERVDPIQTWGATDSYVTNNVVLFSGNLYRADQNITGPVDVATRNPVTDDNDEWTAISGEPTLDEITNVNEGTRVAADDGKQYGLVYDRQTPVENSVYNLTEIITNLRTWNNTTAYTTDEAVVHNEYLYRATRDVAAGRDNPEENSAGGEDWQRVSVRNLGDLQDINTSNIGSSTATGDYFTMRWNDSDDSGRTYDQLDLINTIGIVPWVSGTDYDDDTLVFVDETIYIRNGAAITTNITPTPAANEIRPTDSETGWTWIAGPRHTTHQDHSQYTLRGVDTDDVLNSELVLEGSEGIPAVRDDLNTGQFAYSRSDGRAGAATGDGRQVLRFNVSDNQSPSVQLRDAFNLIFDDDTVTQLQFVITRPDGRTIEYQTVGDAQATEMRGGRIRTTAGSQIWRGTAQNTGSDGAVATQYAFIVETVTGANLEAGDVGSGNFTIRVLENHRNVTNAVTPNHISGGAEDQILITGADGDTEWGTANTDSITDDAVTTAKIADDAINTDKLDADPSALEVNDERYLQVTRGADDADGNATYSLAWETIEESNNLIFSDLDTNNQRRLTQYHNGTDTEDVRSVAITSNEFVLTFAHFDPTFTAASQTVNWDADPGTITTTVTNNDDYFDEYLSGIRQVTFTGGSTSTPVTSGFTTNPAVVPRPTGSTNNQWTGSLPLDSTTFVRPSTASVTGTTISGDTVNGTFFYLQTDDATPPAVTNYAGTSAFTITWRPATIDVQTAALSGETFLKEYERVTYTETRRNITTAANAVINLTPPSGATLSALTSSFTSLDLNHSQTASFSWDATVSRTILGGTTETVTIGSQTRNISATWDYPNISQETGTASTAYPDDNSDWVDDSTANGFDAGVTIEARSGGHFIDRSINISGTSPQVFWLGVRSSATQPTSFLTGPSSSLLTSTRVTDLGTTNNRIGLEPATPPTGFVAEDYTFYGIILQPGDTYVRIS